ncbi:glycosyltransferase family 25 protein [Aulographum hederae CBS 113979]|uniref:Glycosyltransferase family 25 protein n=1 Tax=Aulographum hederae CBS 113979 TaxID=1176131 RepID=A0A6G1H5E2_9PEZI|nr:glycosyltransferase family 25 protein [Aulographum hederae CBS 113979]
MSKMIPKRVCLFTTGFIFTCLFISATVYALFESRTTTSSRPPPRTSNTLRMPRSEYLFPKHTSFRHISLTRPTSFQKIFAVTLPFRTDQRDVLTLAAATTNLSIDWIDGIKGEDVSDKSLPPGMFEANLPAGPKGCWRAHLNAWQTIVDQNIASALIMEGDADWALRIKSQMHDFALATNALTQPLTTKPRDRLHGRQLRPQLYTPSVSSSETLNPLSTCPSSTPSNDSGRYPLGRIHYHDPSVPIPAHMHHLFGSASAALAKDYNNHTRAVSRVSKAICTTAYGISDAGARRALYSLGVRGMGSPVDLALLQFCDGDSGETGDSNGEHVCLAPQPMLFEQHHVKEGGGSDMNVKTSGEKFKEAWTWNLRWSTRVNLGRLVAGRTDWVDQWPDE